MPQLLSESELEEHLYELLEKGEDINGEFSGHPFRQVQIPEYGTADIITIDLEPDYNVGLRINIIELKKGAIDLNAVGQICRYKTAIDRLIEKNPRIKKHFSVNINGYLIGSEIGSGDVCFVIDHIEWLTVITHAVSLSSGLTLETDGGGWHQKGEDFTPLERKFMDFFHEKLMPQYREFYEHSGRIYSIRQEKKQATK